MKKSIGIFVKVIIGILAVLGVLFILIMLMPDDEESDLENQASENIESATTEAVMPEINEGNSAKADVRAISVGTHAKTATIMVYMNGSDLETEAGEATEDISEMISSGIGEKVNVIIQTMGTREWQDYDISSKSAQTYKIENGELVLIRDNLGQLDCTSKKTLSEFIGFCKTNYPADRYLCIFWNHGGGPVYGFGYDEWQDEDSSLTIDEMAAAFSEHKDIYFDIIGMDCCIMANLETCYALAPFCKYTVLSEDFESGYGWSYSKWMKDFENNPGIATPLLGRTIVDDMIKDNEDSYEDYSACMGLFNESTTKDLFSAWKAYAYKNEDALLNKNYSKMHRAKGRARNRGFWDFWDDDESDVTLSDYYISDILALVEGIDNSSDEAKKLMSALKAAVAYYGHTSDKNELTGLSVSLPYGDEYFYDKLRSVYKGIDFDEEYLKWLEKFVFAESYDDYYNYDSFEDSWNGWGEYESEYGCNLSNGSCEYGYDYDSDDYYSDDYYSDDDEDYADDWIYDSELDMWYLYEYGVFYLYDEKTDTTFYYDESEDEMYYYDEDTDEWVFAE